jgi:hypothetical protein
MRHDYKYVDDASDLCLTTIELADDQTDRLVRSGMNRSVDISKDATHDLRLSRAEVDFIEYIEQDYVKVSSSVSMKDWLKAADEQHIENYERPLEITYEEFTSLFVNGLVTIRKVIWD